MSEFEEEVDTIIFRDEYVVVVTSKKTYTLKYKDMGEHSRVWLDTIQSSALSMVRFPHLRSKFFNTDRE